MVEARSHRSSSWAFSAALTLVSFPGPLLAGAAGLLFGAVEGGLLALGAATIGATAASLVGRQIVDGTIAVPGTRVVRMLKTLRRAPFVAVLYARILPAVPFSLVSYACGILRIPLAAFVGATALGAAPRAFAYAALGGSLGDLSSPTAIAAVAVLVAMALAGAVLARRAW